jgi:putative proteasome-type protease
VTYCLGMLLEDGLILMADTRTNAGVDNFSTFRKLHKLSAAPDREIFAATAGNLSISQSVISLLQEDQLRAETGDVSKSLSDAPTMFRAAQIVGEAVARIGETVGTALAREHIDNHVELLVGGRVGDGRLQLFHVYSIGNFIECTPEVPFLQVGETKYGRPILDRALGFATPLAEAVKIGVLSFDSTMQSNLGVARPIDILVIPADARQKPMTRRIGRDDPYFDELTRAWGALLGSAALDLPNPPWMGELREQEAAE